MHPNSQSQFYFVSHYIKINITAIHSYFSKSKSQFIFCPSSKHISRNFFPSLIKTVTHNYCKNKMNTKFCLDRLVNNCRILKVSTWLPTSKQSHSILTKVILIGAKATWRLNSWDSLPSVKKTITRLIEKLQ